MPRILVAAADPLARAGLAALLSPHLDIVAAVSMSALASVHADALVADLHGAADFVLPDGGTPTLALVADRAGARRAIGAGARGVLARDGDGPRIARAILALLDGLVVLDEPFAAVLLPEPELADGLALTIREQEVLALLAEGLSNKEIAVRLGVSEHTAKFHVKGLLNKLGATSRTDAVVRAARAGRLLL